MSAFFDHFREAAPYIHAFRHKTFVIAFGGELLLREGQLRAVCFDVNVLVSLGIRVVLVHGVRPQIDAVLSSRGVCVRYHKHRRITDAEGLAAARQAVGLARGEIESALSMALPNSPMAGANLRVLSGNFITARPLGILDGIDMQFTGSVRRVDGEGMRLALESGAVVLVSPLGFSSTGESFNVTMEETACEIARTLKAEKLIFLNDFERFRDAYHGLNELTQSDAQQLLTTLPPEHPLSSWLAHGLSALEAGVLRVHGVNDREDGALLTELFTHEGSGILMSRERISEIRPAGLADVTAILALIDPLVRSGALIDRSRQEIEQMISSFFVLTHDYCVIACAALTVYEHERMAEIACVAVSGAWRSGGHGEYLLNFLRQEAKKLGVLRVFVLTTQTAHWFLEQGFEPDCLDNLPQKKRETYNHQRRSQILSRAV